MRNRGLSVAVAVVVSVLATGCASFRQGIDSPLEPWPPQAAATKRPITIQMTGIAEMNGRQQDAPQGMMGKWLTPTLNAYEESELFSKVNYQGEDSDLIAEITIEDRGKGSLIMAFLTGLTWYLLPSSFTDEFTVSTRFRTQGGQVLATITKQESVITRQHFVMLFYASGRSLQEVPLETLYDLNRATILEAAARGIF